MKIKFGEENNKDLFIEFKTDVKGLEKIQPPKKASFYTPTWFREMSDHIERNPNHHGPPNAFGKVGKTAEKWHQATAKRCPAIVDYITQGFIIPMWCDYLIQIGETNTKGKDLLEWDNKNFPYGIEFHANEQLYNYPFKKNDFFEGVKFNNPWRIYTPEGYSVMFVAPYYQHERRFTVLPGIVETDSYHHVNFPTIFHRRKDIFIDRGTPFIQVIPFKREKFNMNIETMSSEDIDNDKAEKLELNTKFKNAYRSITQRIKNDR